MINVGILKKRFRINTKSTKIIMLDHLGSSRLKYIGFASLVSIQIPVFEKLMILGTLIKVCLRPARD